MQMQMLTTSQLDLLPCLRTFLSCFQCIENCELIHDIFVIEGQVLWRAIALVCRISERQTQRDGVWLTGQQAQVAAVGQSDFTR